MAATNLSDVSAALSLVFRPRITSQIASLTVLPFLLPILPGEGKNCSWTVEVAGATNAAASAEGVARSSSDADDETELPATLNWAQYDKVASVTGLAEAAVRANVNPASIGAMANSLMQGRVMSQSRRVVLGVAGNLYSGDPTASPVQIAGAATYIDSSGTFAGINPGTYTDWVASENTHALADISIQAIREKLLTPVYSASNEQPEFMTCPANIFDKVRGLLGDKEKAVQEIGLRRGGGSDGMDPRSVKLNAGMAAVSIDGVPLVRDPQCTANTIYGWNTNYIAIRELPPFGGIFDPNPAGILDFFRRLTDNPKLTMPREVLEGMAARSRGITPHVKLLGRRGDSTEAMILWYGQMEVTRRNAQGKLTFS